MRAFLLGAAVLIHVVAAYAQPLQPYTRFINDSTPYTRELMRATNAAHARAILGIDGPMDFVTRSLTIMDITGNGAGGHDGVWFWGNGGGLTNLAIPPTTVFTRDWLTSPDQATARTKLSIVDPPPATVYMLDFLTAIDAATARTKLGAAASSDIPVVPPTTVFTRDWLTSDDVSAARSKLNIIDPPPAPDLSSYLTNQDIRAIYLNGPLRVTNVVRLDSGWESAPATGAASGTVNVDFSKPIQRLTAGGAITLGNAVLPAAGGAMVSITLVGGASDYTLSATGGWLGYGSHSTNNVPIRTGKTYQLSVKYDGEFHWGIIPNN